MAWGAAKKGLEDINARLEANDTSLTSLHVLRFRRVAEQARRGAARRHARSRPSPPANAHSRRPAPRPQDIAGLCAALRRNSTLTELSLTCHALPPPAAAALGAALAANRALRAASLGDSTFGDAGLVALAPGLAANTSLARLDLEHKVRRRRRPCSRPATPPSPTSGPPAPRVAAALRGAAAARRLRRTPYPLP